MNKNKHIEAKVEKYYSQNGEYNSYIAKLKYSGRFEDRFIIYIKKEENKELLSKGDVIEFNSKINKISYYNNYNEFNYKLYLNSNKIVGSIFVDRFDMIYDKQTKEGYIQKFEKNIDRIFEPDVSATIKAVLLGNKSGLSDKTLESFSVAGISHILTVSGTAIYILRKFLSKIFKRYRHKNFVNLVAISFYFSICTFSVSICRAYIMYILNTLSSRLRFKLSFIEVISICFILILIINPYYIFSYSLWYSFMAVIGIKTIFPLINSFLNIRLLKLYKSRSEVYVKNKLSFKFFKYIISAFSLTISVQFILFPIYMFSSNKFYFISLVSSLFAGTLVIAIYVIGFIYILIFYLPFISKILSYIIKILVKLLLAFCNISSKFDKFNISFSKISIILAVLIYLFIFIHIYGYHLFMNMKYRYGKKLSKTFKTLLYFIFVLIILSSLLLSNFSNFIYYFNIGQGNMSLIKYNKITIISDIGSVSTNVKPILINFLKAYNIKQIDYLFLSHMHEDHINGLYNLEDEILEGNIHIKNIVIGYGDKKLKEYLNRYSINIIEVKAGDTLTLGKDLEAYILSPNIQSYIKSKDEMNANSLVYSIRVKDKNILFTGDASNETEKEIVKTNLEFNDFYILQVAHHGSSTSTCEEFLNKFSFKYAVISSEKRVYGHPSDETINILNKYKIKQYILENIGGKRVYI